MAVLRARVAIADLNSDGKPDLVVADYTDSILAQRAMDALLDRLIPDLDGEGVRNADLIIEAVPEKLELKQKVYASLEPRMKPGASTTWARR